jgi:hypothetical protein
MRMRGAAAGSWTTWWAPRPEPAAEAWQDFQAAVAWLLGLQILDLLTTLGGLAHGAVEANPLGRLVLLHGGPAGLVQAKLAATVLVLGWIPAFALTRPGQRPAFAWRSVLALAVLLALTYSAVVVHNLAVLAVQARG